MEGPIKFITLDGPIEDENSKYVIIYLFYFIHRIYSLHYYLISLNNIKKICTQSRSC